MRLRAVSQASMAERQYLGNSARSMRGSGRLSWLEDKLAWTSLLCRLCYCYCSPTVVVLPSGNSARGLKDGALVVPDTLYLVTAKRPDKQETEKKQNSRR
jgi:hypothetical protein